jgi:Ca2+-binding RTX toxin-like protein
MATKFGTTGSDTITGSNDIIFGYPNGGDPEIDLGDDLSSTGGSVTIHGGGGDDTITGAGGSDQLNGGSGADSILGGAGDDRLEGGPGDDTMDGGSGQDFIVSDGGADRIDGGSGIDFAGFYIDTLQADLTAVTQDIVFDLSVDLTVELVNGFGFTGIESLRLMSGSGNDNITLFRGLEASDFDDRNMVDGGAGNDSIKSWDGSFNGYQEAFDTLLGGAGNDTLVGAYEMDGGADDDLLIAGDVYNELSDTLIGLSILKGGTGNDTLKGGKYTDDLSGGDGNDLIEAKSMFVGDITYFDILDGGDGLDTLIGGNGADLFTDTSSDAFVETLNGGLGPDQFEFNDWYQGAAVDVIVGFVGGAGGDSLGVVSLLDAGSDRDPWNSDNYDPFADGYLRLKQSGADTLLQFDVDGAAGPATWQDVVLLKDVTATDLTVENFESWPTAFLYDFGFYAEYYQPAYAPDDVPPTDPTPGPDSIVGGSAPDLIKGLAGDDTLDGAEGNDTLSGGAGNDVLRGMQDDDVIDGGEGHDSISGGRGNDTIRGAGGDDSIYGGLGDDDIQGGTGDDRLTGAGGLDTFRFFLNFGDDVLADYADGDTLAFGAGLAGAGGMQVSSVAGIKALVSSSASLDVHVGTKDVVLMFASGDSLRLTDLADEWTLVI